MDAALVELLQTCRPAQKQYIAKAAVCALKRLVTKQSQGFGAAAEPWKWSASKYKAAEPHVRMPMV